MSLSLGSAYFRAETVPGSRAAVPGAIVADPKAGEAHNNLAVILMMKAQYIDAMAELKAGFRVNPELKDQIKSRMAQ